MPFEKPPTLSSRRSQRSSRRRCRSTWLEARSAGRSYISAKNSRFCQALRRSYKPGVSVRIPTDCRMASLCSPRRCPATVAVPRVGAIKAESIRTVVVLPAPFGRRKSKPVPSGMASVKSSTATRLPKAGVNWLVSIAFIGSSFTPSKRQAAREPHALRAKSIGCDHWVLRRRQWDACPGEQRIPNDGQRRIRAGWELRLPDDRPILARERYDLTGECGCEHQAIRDRSPTQPHLWERRCPQLLPRGQGGGDHLTARLPPIRRAHAGSRGAAAC